MILVRRIYRLKGTEKVYQTRGIARHFVSGLSLVIFTEFEAEDKLVQVCEQERFEESFELTDYML